MAGNMTGGVPTFTQWYPGTPGPQNPAGPVGSMPPQPWPRSQLDAKRMMARRQPDAQYPSGYLGTITSRRGDRMLDSLKARQNQRNYQRGVHKGERIDPGDYLWPDEMSPFDGVRREATTGQRNAPLLQFFQPTPVVEGKFMPRGSESILTIDEHRASVLGMVAPKWGFPVRKAPYQG